MAFRWNKQLVLEDAKKYSLKKEWRAKSASAYVYSKIHKFVDEACAHMNVDYWWTKETALIEAKKHLNRSSWQKSGGRSYRFAKENGIFEECVAHMNPIEFWSKKKVIEEAKKHKSRTEWIRHSAGSYNYAYRHDFLEEASLHMGKTRSLPQKELETLIRSQYPNIKTNKCFTAKNLAVPSTRFELDILVTELNKGIEFDGIYHHSFNGLKRGRPKWTDEQLINYHQIKDTFFSSIGIQVLHIKEADWISDKRACLKKALEFLEA